MKEIKPFKHHPSPFILVISSDWDITHTATSEIMTPLCSNMKQVTLIFPSTPEYKEKGEGFRRLARRKGWPLIEVHPRSYMELGLTHTVVIGDNTSDILKRERRLIGLDCHREVNFIKDC
jgi:hypothetical protein